jgi:aromatase
MPTVCRTVELDVPFDVAFALSNRLEDWPVMMEEYQAVEILRREGMKIWFRLSHASGSSWVSWRLLHPALGVCLAERHEPRAPFAFMHHTWSYQRLGPERTAMTWSMTYGLPAPTPEQDQACSAYLLASTEKNQSRMKAHIERMHRGGGAA